MMKHSQRKTSEDANNTHQTYPTIAIRAHVASGANGEGNSRRETLSASVVLSDVHGRNVLSISAHPHPANNKIAYSDHGVTMEH